MAVLRRRSGRDEVLAARRDQRPHRPGAPRRLAVEDRRGAARRIRHTPGRLRGHAADDRRGALRRHAVQPRRRAERGDRRADLGLRSQELSGRPAAQRHRLRASRGRRVARRRPAPHLPQHPVPADLPRRGHRTTGRFVRRQRHRRSEPGARLGHQQAPLHEYLAAGRLQGPRHPRQRRRRSAHLPSRSARRRARVRRAHGAPGLDVPHDPAAGRVGQRHLGKRVLALHRPHERLGADDARRGARPAVPAGEHAEQRLLRRQPARREPLRRVARVPRRRDRSAQVALPARPPRPVGLRSARAAHARVT